MNKVILHDPALIDAAVVDIDARQLANQARTEFAEKHGAVGHKVVLAAQDGGNGTEISAVTLLKFDGRSPQDFVTVGQDKDGRVLALPDMRTPRGDAIANAMGNLPSYPSNLANAMGLAPKIKGGKVSFGIVNVEEVGRQIVVSTNRSVSSVLDVEPISADSCASLKQGADRAKKMAAVNAPNPFGR